MSFHCKQPIDEEQVAFILAGVAEALRQVEESRQRRQRAEAPPHSCSDFTAPTGER